MLRLEARPAPSKAMSLASPLLALLVTVLAGAALFVLRRHRLRRVVLIVDGQAHALRCASLTIALGAVDDASGHWFGRSRLDAGVLCAYVVRRRGLLDWLRVTWRLARGVGQDQALSVFSGTQMELRAAPRVLHVMVDGEVQVLPTPIVFSVQPGALTVIAP